MVQRLATDSMQTPAMGVETVARAVDPSREASFSPVDEDAATRFLRAAPDTDADGADGADRRRRADTPTVKDVFPAGALLEDTLDEPTVAATPSEVDETVLLAGSRRRTVALAMLLMVLLALAAFVLAGSMLEAEPDEVLRPEPTTGTGEQLPSPTIR